MSIKRTICLTLCIILLCSCTACKKLNHSDSAFSSTSVITENYGEVEFIEPNNTNTSSQANTTSQNTTSQPNTTSSTASTVSDTSSDSQSSNKDVLAMLYGFSSIKKVNYYCIKNLPNSDTIYTVTDIITDADTNICDVTTQILCDDKNIIIDQKNITVPSSYLKKHKSVKLTAYHAGTEAKYDFDLKFEDKWDVIFEDNFDGNTINTDVWNIWDSADWQYFYSPDSLFLDGEGHLINRVSVLETADSKYGYVRQSGAMTTQDKFTSTYGYYEIRLKPHLTYGMWSAFWLMAGDMGDKDAANDSTATNGCEIDVIESIYKTKIPSHAIHWDGYYNDQTKSLNTNGKIAPNPEVFDGNFHTFAVRWSDQGYAFLVDGKITYNCTAAEVDSCNQPAYMLISSHFGEEWAGDVTLKAGEHSDTVVDYVKVYQSQNDPK